MADSGTQACAHCGENHPTNVRFCPNCGNPVLGPPGADLLDGTSTKQSLELHQAKSNNRPRWVGLLAALLIVIIIVIVVLIHALKHGTGTQDSVQTSAPLTSGESISAGPSRVPFVGCKSDGQGGPVDAPKGESKVVPIDAETAQRLAYYAVGEDFGVLAPRGWYCFGSYGSNGEFLSVSPRPINYTNMSSAVYEGTGIRLSDTSGDTSGRFEVAKTIARVFPAHREFVNNLIAGGGEYQASDFTFGPFPNDKLTYKSNEIVEYQTPAHSEGLGGDSRAVTTTDPISGVAILLGQDPDLLQLSLRLSPGQNDLAAFIIQQVERDAATQQQTALSHDDSSHDQDKPPQEQTTNSAATDQK